MIDSHQRPNKVKLCEELVHGHSNRLERIDRVVVLNELIMRASHPWEAEQATKRWIDQHR